MLFCFLHLYICFSFHSTKTGFSAFQGSGDRASALASVLDRPLQDPEVQYQVIRPNSCNTDVLCLDLQSAQKRPLAQNWGWSMNWGTLEVQVPMFSIVLALAS